MVATDALAAASVAAIAADATIETHDTAAITEPVAATAAIVAPIVGPIESVRNKKAELCYFGGI